MGIKKVDIRKFQALAERIAEVQTKLTLETQRKKRNALIGQVASGIGVFCVAGVQLLKVSGEKRAALQLSDERAKNKIEMEEERNRHLREDARMKKEVMIKEHEAKEAKQSSEKRLNDLKDEHTKEIKDLKAKQKLEQVERTKSDQELEEMKKAQ